MKRQAPKAATLATADPLEAYRTKRDFTKTSEPLHEALASGKSPVFAIQKHAASRLHYDFRLELDGVLLS